jgi:hypothetical protein
VAALVIFGMVSWVWKRGGPPGAGIGSTVPRYSPPSSRAPRKKSTRETPEPTLAAGSKAMPETT